MRLAWDGDQVIGPIAETEEGGWLLMLPFYDEGPTYAMRPARYAFVDIEPFPDMAARLAHDFDAFNLNTKDDNNENRT